MCAPHGQKYVDALPLLGLFFLVWTQRNLNAAPDDRILSSASSFVEEQPGGDLFLLQHDNTPVHKDMVSLFLRGVTFTLCAYSAHLSHVSEEGFLLFLSSKRSFLSPPEGVFLRLCS